LEHYIHEGRYKMSTGERYPVRENGLVIVDPLNDFRVLKNSIVEPFDEEKSQMPLSFVGNSFPF